MQKDNIEETPQEVHENKYWQWVKGEKSGDVVTIKNIDDKWINFNDTKVSIVEDQETHRYYG